MVARGCYNPWAHVLLNIMLVYFLHLCCFFHWQVRLFLPKPPFSYHPRALLVMDWRAQDEPPIVEMATLGDSDKSASKNSVMMRQNYTKIQGHRRWKFGYRKKISFLINQSHLSSPFDCGKIFILKATISTIISSLQPSLEHPQGLIMECLSLQSCCSVPLSIAYHPICIP